MSTAAIGVGGGLVAAGAGYFAGLMAAVLPVAYGLTVGSHFLPSIIGFSLIRKPGIAILTGLIAGLVGAAFAPQWALRYLGTGLLVGALIELPFLLSRYRKWNSWLYYVAAGVAGLVLGGAVFVTFDASRFAPVVQVVYLGLFVLSPLLFTWLGRLIAAALQRAGVGNLT